MENSNIDSINVQVIIENEIEKSKQILDAYQADWDTCPQCNSDNIEWGDAEPDGALIYRIHSCEDCGVKWEERYDLVKVRIYEE